MDIKTFAVDNLLWAINNTTFNCSIEGVSEAWEDPDKVSSIGSDIVSYVCDIKVGEDGIAITGNPITPFAAFDNFDFTQRKPTTRTVNIKFSDIDLIKCVEASIWIFLKITEEDAVEKDENGDPVQYKQVVVLF